MKRFLSSLAAVVMAASLALTGCANLTPVVGPSPEAQLMASADTVAAVTATTTVLLRRQAISVTQAESYRNMLAASGKTLKDAKAQLEACRAAAPRTVPPAADTCWLGVSDVAVIALDNVAAVKRTLDAK